MPKNKPDKSEQDKSVGLITKLLPDNKAVALSLAVTLALAGFTMPVSALSIDSSNAKNNKDTVLVQEKDDEEEADWETDEEQSYSYYGTGNGYFYRPFYYSGGIPGRASWSSAKTTKSVGGYHISRGHVGS